jgi:hypothetical protein
MLLIIAYLAVAVLLGLAVGRVLAYCGEMEPKPGKHVRVDKAWWSLEDD